MAKTVRYLAFVLDDESRVKLLEAFPPLFQDVKAHHITIVSDIEGPHGSPLMFGDMSWTPGPTVEVMNHRFNDKIQCVGVNYDGNVMRSDGSFYHVTISKDPSARSVDSNSLDYPRPAAPLRLTGKVQILEREE